MAMGVEFKLDTPFGDHLLVLGTFDPQAINVRGHHAIGRAVPAASGAQDDAAIALGTKPSRKDKVETSSGDTFSVPQFLDGIKRPTDASAGA